MNIALVGPTDRSIWAFRRGLMQILQDEGHSVSAVCSRGEYVPRLQAMGVNHIPVEMSRFVNPFADIRYCLNLYQVFRTIRFDLVHTFTVKPNVYGAIAAKLAGVPELYALVEGLGFGYPDGESAWAKLSRLVLRSLYRIPGALCRRIWFINKDDESLFLSSGIISERQAVFIRSVGVDTDEYRMQSVERESVESLRRELGIAPETLCVTMVGRMTWSKGVREFVESARILQERWPSVKYLLIGEIQPGSPLSVPVDYLTGHGVRGLQWLAFRSDVRELLALSNVVVLPSYYREGVPRTLLEAMAMEKPIVTTDYVGCREVVVDGKNGYLVPIKDPESLAQAIERLLQDGDKRAAFGQYGRRWVEDEFDEGIVVRRVLRELYRLTPPTSVSGDSPGAEESRA